MEKLPDIAASHESIMISDLRFSLGRRVRLISFLRHIGEGIEPLPSLRGVRA